MAAARKSKAPQEKSGPADNGKPGVQPSVRIFKTWTPGAINAAEIQADAGNLRAAATLCEWIMRDDRVQGTLGARSDALFGLDPTFEASGDKRRSNRAVRALEGGEDWFDSYPESENSLMLKWGIVLGLSPARHQWVDGGDAHDGRTLPKPKFWHPLHVRFDDLTRRWLTWAQLTPTSGQVEVEIVPGDGDWLLHRPYGEDRPWAWGAWHALAPLVLLKWLAWWDRSRAGEKGALLVGTIEEGTTFPDNKPGHVVRRELAEELYRRGRDGVCILPVGFDLKMVQLAAGTNDIYKSQIEMANDAIAVNIRGGNLTTEVRDQGSRAATESQERTGDRGKLRWDAQSFTTTIHDQSLVHWAAQNFGDPDLAPWPVYPVAPKSDQKREAETANLALDAAKKGNELGFKVNAQAFAEKFGQDDWLEAPEGGELKQPAPPPAPGAPAPGSPPAPPAPNPEEEDDSDEPPEPPKAKARSLARFRLASGDSLRSGRGFLDGQLYADALTENATEDGIAALEPTIVAILEELDAATDYDDLRARLRARYEELDPEEISDIISAAMTLGELAGRVAVNQDA